MGREKIERGRTTGLSSVQVAKINDSFRAGKGRASGAGVFGLRFFEFFCYKISPHFSPVSSGCVPRKMTSSKWCAARSKRKQLKMHHFFVKIRSKTLNLRFSPFRMREKNWGQARKCGEKRRFFGCSFSRLVFFVKK